MSERITSGKITSSQILVFVFKCRSSPKVEASVAPKSSGSYPLSCTKLQHSQWSQVKANLLKLGLTLESTVTIEMTLCPLGRVRDMTLYSNF